MSIREERMAKTESLFRNVNERIAEASERFDAGDNGDGEFMCECADPGCAERLEVPLEEYEQVREDATTFVLDPEHISRVRRQLTANLDSGGGELVLQQ